MNMFWSLFWPLFVIVIVGLIAYNKWIDLSYLLREFRNPFLGDEGHFLTDEEGRDISKESLKFSIIRNAIGLFVAITVIVFCIVVIIKTI